jgi:hypothetical protein
VLVGGVCHVSPPKSMAGVRWLALDEFTTDLLAWHWTKQQGRYDGRNLLNRPLFTHRDGRPVRPDWITHRFAELVEQLNLPPVRFHDLRHGAASLAGAANVPLKVIQHGLGHSTAGHHRRHLRDRHARTRPSRNRCHRPAPTLARQVPHEAGGRSPGVNVVSSATAPSHRRPVEPVRDRRRRRRRTRSCHGCWGRTPPRRVQDEALVAGVQDHRVPDSGTGGRE